MLTGWVVKRNFVAVGEPMEGDAKKLLAEMVQHAEATSNGQSMVQARAAIDHAARGGGRDAEPLSRKFRRLTRELMIDETIQRLIRDRVILELSGGTKDTHVVCTLMRIAGGAASMKGPVPQRKDEDRWLAPSIHVHLDRLTDEQLQNFYQHGVRPPALHLTEGTKTVDVEE